MRKITITIFSFLFGMFFISCSGTYQISDESITKINLYEGIYIKCEAQDDLKIVQMLVGSIGVKGYPVSEYFNENFRYTFTFNYSSQNDKNLGKVIARLDGRLFDRKNNKSIKSIKYSRDILAVSETNKEVVNTVLEEIYSMQQ